MTIPIGKDYTFVIQVLQPNSLEPLDVTGYLGTINIFRQDDYTNLPVDDVAIIPVVGSEAFGMMTGTILGTTTSAIVIDADDKGEPADDYYIKDRYAGFIALTKAGNTDVNVSIPAISFVFAG